MPQELLRTAYLPLRVSMSADQDYIHVSLVSSSWGSILGVVFKGKEKPVSDFQWASRFCWIWSWEGQNLSILQIEGLDITIPRLQAGLLNGNACQFMCCPACQPLATWDYWSLKHGRSELKCPKSVNCTLDFWTASKQNKTKTTYLINNFIPITCWNDSILEILS